MSSSKGVGAEEVVEVAVEVEGWEDRGRFD